MGNCFSAPSDDDKKKKKEKDGAGGKPKKTEKGIFPSDKSWKKDDPLRKYSYQLCPAIKQVHQNRIANRSEKVEDYECKGLQGGMWIRGPGQVHDQRVTLENCGNQASIVIADMVDSVQADDINDCVIFIGPASGSVFLRNVNRCRIVCACSQLRMRDCKDTDISLLAKTRPVIENCKNIGFGPYCTAGYFCLREHFAQAQLSLMTNKFYLVHDFTPEPGNFRFMTIDEASKIVPSLLPVSPNGELVTEDEDAMLKQDVTVPISTGSLKRSEIAAVVVFNAGQYDEAENLARQFHVGQIVYTLEHMFTEQEATQCFGARLQGKLLNNVASGVVVCLAITGPVPEGLFNQSCVCEVIEGADVHDIAESVFMLMEGQGFGKAF